MDSCCSRMSKWYMITTNLLFACLGIAFMAFGLLGYRDSFKGATLFPHIIFTLMAILGAVIIVAALFGILGAYVKKKSLILVYMAIVLIALVYQVVIGVKVYQKASNTMQYLSTLWSSSNVHYRTHIQDQFSCCGFNNVMDNPAITDVCNPQHGIASAPPPCFDALTSYVHTSFKQVYLVVFAALAIEILALSNAITLLCTQAMDPDDEERRRRRKSGIRLDDLQSPDTLTGPNNHYYDEPKRENRKPDTINDNRYDSYDQYKQKQSNTYGDKYY
ncbi:Tetraspanin family-domain-containing protein [Phycomyces blakesleeanus]